MIALSVGRRQDSPDIKAALDVHALNMLQRPILRFNANMAEQ